MQKSTIYQKNLNCDYKFGSNWFKIIAHLKKCTKHRGTTLAENLIFVYYYLLYFIFPFGSGVLLKL